MLGYLQKILPASLACVLLLMAGCGGSGIRTSYYTLNALAQIQPGQARIADLHNYVLALGPVSLPAALTNRAQIMAADGPNRLVMMENARWAEPLDTNIMLVLSDNLAHLLNMGNIVQFPWRAAAAFDLQVEMTVFTLTADRDKADLRAHYIVTNVKTGLIVENRLNLTTPVVRFAADEIVAAQNTLINQASIAIAHDVVKAVK